jgi:hypothetical protein
LKFFINGAGAPAIPGESSNPHLNQSELSWTVGTNYTVAPDLAVYARASEGHHFPTFDDVRSQLGQTATEDVLDKPWDIKSLEAGMFNNNTFEANVTAFTMRCAVRPTTMLESRRCLQDQTPTAEFDGRWNSTFGQHHHQ